MRLHPAIGDVIAVAGRNWRKAPWRASTWQQVWNFLRLLRARAYDQIVDTQGLFIKSALIARAARGRVTATIPTASRRCSPAPSMMWSMRGVEPARDCAQPRADRLALGYTPDGPPDFGLDRAALAGPAAAPYGVLLHATARATRNGGGELADAGGGARDKYRSDRAVRHRGRARTRQPDSPRPHRAARVPDRAPLDQVARMIAGDCVRGRRRHRASAPRCSARACRWSRSSRRASRA